MRQIAYRLASVMVKEAGDSKPIEVIAYGLEILISIITQMSILILVGYLFHILPTLSAALLPAIFFRSLSGGNHCSSFYCCTFLSTITFSFIGYLSIQLNIRLDIVIAIYLIMFLATFIWAPINPKRKAFNKRKSQLLKILSLLFLGLMFFLSYTLSLPQEIITAIMLGLSWQVFSISPLGISVIDKIDYFIIRKGDKIRTCLKN